MIPDINCFRNKLNCKLSQYDSRYKPLWVRKGYSFNGNARTNIENIFLGYNLNQTVSSSLAGVEIGSTNTGANSITIAANDIEIFVNKKHNSEWYRQDVIYFAVQEKFHQEGSNLFLNSRGDINGKLYKCLQIVDRSMDMYKLILREFETRNLRNGESVISNTRN